MLNFDCSHLKSNHIKDKNILLYDCNNKCGNFSCMREIKKQRKKYLKIKNRKFMPGDHVKIRKWDDMEKEFWLDEDGDINYPDCPTFTKDMKYLCGKHAVIDRISNTQVYFREIYNADYDDVEDWYYDLFMIEHV